MSALFGGSKSKSSSTSSSSNKAYDSLVGTTAPAIRSGNAATSQIERMLGIGGPTMEYVPPKNALDFLGRSLSGNGAMYQPYAGVGAGPSFDPMNNGFNAAPEIFERGGGAGRPYLTQMPTEAPQSAGGGFGSWLDNSGYSFVRDQGVNAIAGNFAGRGASKSGAAMKALMRFGQNNASTYLQQYLDNLFKQQQGGLGAQGILSGAGNVSSSSSTGMSSTNNGAGQAIGSALSMIAMSDARLKENVEKIGELENGLGVYKFDYIWGDTNRIGVMADEVAVIQPDALGPTVNGYLSVDYSKLEGWVD